MIAKTLAFGFSLALPLLLARRLSRDQYGLYQQVFQVVATAIVLLPFGFGMSAYYFLPREPEKRCQVIFNIVAFNLLIGLTVCTVFVVAPQSLAHLLGNDQLTPLAPMVGLVVLFWLLAGFLETVTVANEERGLTPLFIICAQLTKTGLLFGFALVGASVKALVIAALIQGILQTVILAFYLQSRFPGFWHSFDPKMLRRQVLYALPFSLSSLLWAVQGDLHNYFVSHGFGPEKFAIYKVGCFDLPLIAILAESVNAVMIPRISFLQKSGTTREIIELTTGVIRKLAAVYVPAYVFLLLLGREFIVGLFTEKYSASWPVFVLYLTLIPTAALVLDAVARAYEEIGYFIFRFRLFIICALVLALSLGVRYGRLEVMVGLVVAIALVERFTIAWKIGRVVGFARADFARLSDLGKIVLAALCSGVVTFVVRYVLVQELKPLPVLFVCAVVFGITYAGAVLALGLPNAEEREFAQTRVAALLAQFGLRKKALGLES
jgi:O-antigen/teichoic acid export membrane protein